jgi:hypothetical protein
MFLVIAAWIAVTVPTGRVVRFVQHVIPVGSSVHERAYVGYPGFPFGGRVLTVLGDRIGFAVAGVWLALLLVGRWKAEPSWIDRLGRALGCLWIVLTAVLWLRCYSI